MKKNLKVKFSVPILVLVFVLTCFLPLSSSTKVEKLSNQNTMITEGQILYSPMWSTNTHLLEYDGNLNHTWYSSYFPGVMVRWFGDGTIVRTIRVGAGPGSGGAGGGVQKVEWDGTVVWDFIKQSIPSDIIQDIKNLKDKLSSNEKLINELKMLISQQEITAMKDRIQRIIENPVFPLPKDNYRPFPYPLV